jgi:hypothetical protein
MQDRRLTLWFTQILLSSKLSHGVGWIYTDVSRQPISPTFKVQVSKKKVTGLKCSNLYGKQWVEIDLQRARNCPVAW